MLGGGQESGLRSGTEGLPAIAAFAAACRAALPKRTESIARQRRSLAQAQELLRTIDGVQLLGAQEAPHILNLAVPGVRSQGLINALQERDIYVSAGSACSKGHRSHVLEAMGVDAAWIDGSVRVSLSDETTEDDIRALAEAPARRADGAAGRRAARMTRPLRNSSPPSRSRPLTGLLVLAATQWTDVFFRFYPAFSPLDPRRAGRGHERHVLPLWEPGLCLIVLWGVISLIRSLVRHHFLRWLSGLLLTLCGAAFFIMAVWGLNYFAPPMSDRLGLETQERTPAELREVTAYFLQKANETAPLVERDADGVIAASDLSQLGRQAGAGYETLAKTTDCFDGSTAWSRRC